jgi:hypothetical protein
MKLQFLWKHSNQNKPGNIASMQKIGYKINAIIAVPANNKF